MLEVFVFLIFEGSVSRMENMSEDAAYASNIQDEGMYSVCVI